MKGLIQNINNKWLISYMDEKLSIIYFDIDPNIINDDLSSKIGTEVEFEVKNMEYFPYTYAYPKINDNSLGKPPIRTKKRKKIILYFSNFYNITEKTIICDKYSYNSVGFYYFYNDGSDGYIFTCPISRTIINSIEEIDVDY